MDRHLLSAKKINLALVEYAKSVVLSHSVTMIALSTKPVINKYTVT